MTQLFIGRTQELTTLDSLFSKWSSSFLVIKGRRRIGKSRLVEEFSKGKTFYRFCGEVGVNDQTQRGDFARRVPVRERTNCPQAA